MGLDVKTRCHPRKVKGTIVHRGFVWVYADADSPESLLSTKKADVFSKIRTGPKSWQRK
jgi:hypothetical protein